MIEQRFGSQPALAVGLEEELWICDARTLELVPRSAELVAAAAGAALPGSVKTELFASVVETATRPCATAAEALEALRELRRFVAAAARDRGLAILASGSHPTGVPEEQEIAPDPRYLEFVEYAGPSARAQGVSGLHVHVSTPDADSCFRALEWTLPWLPVVLALSANSPYLAGRETGLLSTRAQVLSLLPRAAAPPAFASYRDWEAHVERLSRLGVAADYSNYWWDARLHPRLGTLELRIADQPTSVERAGALAALLQALVAAALASPPPPLDPARRGDYAQNRWAAARFGPRARLVHPAGERTAGVAELLAELCDLVRPAAEELGTAGLVGGLDASSCEADEQLAYGRARGPSALCAALAARSVA